MATGTDPTRDRLRARVRRGLAPGARPTDRLELLSWLACVLLAVAVVPLALATASVVAADAGAQASREAAERRQVPAVLLEDAEVLPGGSASLRATARAAWTAPDGTGHEDTVPVPAGTDAGETVRVWIGVDGDPAGRPLERNDVVVVTVTVGVLTLWLGLATAALLHAAACALLDRARDRAWTREWAESERLWATRFRLR
ncbi:Rv1733c family protein [Geodermatophilus normandii]|uniref:Transmembrane protein n=1 Tax=Geodermatophilus normandii TaxID=1137989 RepID=A0A6P0GG85_9ACTN|nr:hypothetical protein [Geodermatophilus normandii]NEM06260.1 hypothetical protein [Geodermatophilus normandii]